MRDQTKFSYLLILLIYSVFVFSCKRSSDDLLPPTKPVAPLPETTRGDTAITNLFEKTPVIVWIEAAANFSRLATAEKMANIFQKLVDIGVKGVVIDVKGIPGLVSYNSSIATQLKSWNGGTQAVDFDYLKNAITEGKKKGLKVFVSMSIFAEGMNYGGNRIGKVFTDNAFSDIQSQVITQSGDVKKITDVYTYGLLNPLQPLAQEYESSLIREVISNYDLDGFVLDYCRYYDISADFSDFTLEKFRQWAKLPAVSKTDIVAEWTTVNGVLTPKVTGPQYKSWLEFRAQTIRDFVSKTRDMVKSVKPHLPLCSYSGAWYDSYYGVGVNWASNTYDPSADGYSWASPNYKNTGYAELLDMFMTGNYTPALTGSGWWTVQGAINGTKQVLKNANIYYGGVDLGNTQWNNLQNMKDAIKMIKQQTKGVMLFDLVHIDDASTNQFHKQLYDDVKDALAN